MTLQLSTLQLAPASDSPHSRFSSPPGPPAHLQRGCPSPMNDSAFGRTAQPHNRAHDVARPPNRTALSHLKRRAVAHGEGFAGGHLARDLSSPGPDPHISHELVLTCPHTERTFIS